MTLTLQEMFDGALNGLRAQGVCSVGEHGGCLYRGPNGLKCAVGHLIPDELYDSGFELLTLTQIMSETNFGQDVLGGSTKAYELLADMQDAHDNLMPLPGEASSDRSLFAWERRMAEIATEHGLKYEALPT